MSTLLALLSGTQQDYLSEARQMQALSFAVHIPLVCFGIAFPAVILFVEGLYLRTGAPVYKALAKRWSKAMILLFAVGSSPVRSCPSSWGCYGRRSWPGSGTSSGSRS